MYALDLESECTYDCVSLFLDMFDSMPEQSPTTESKAATTPSVDLFGAGTRVDIVSLCVGHLHLFWFLCLCSSVSCFFPPTCLGFPPIVFYTCACNSRGKLWIVLVAAFCLCCLIIPTTLTLFFAPQPPRFSSFSCSASCLHW